MSTPLPTNTGEWAPSLPVEDEAAAFMLRLARALHVAGYSAHRLEDVLHSVAPRLDIGEFHVFSTPTSLFAAFGPLTSQRTFLLRVEPGSVNLGRMTRVDDLVKGILAGTLSPAEGLRELDRLERAPAPYPRLVTVLGFGLSSGAAARFLGGGLDEVAVSAVSGVGLGLLALLAGRVPGLARVFEPTAAVAVALLAAVASALWHPLAVFTATLAGLIVLIPGLVLTTAMTELATQNLAAGTARLAGALLVLFGLLFGVAVGTRLATLAFGVVPVREAVALPGWTIYLALVAIAAGFTIVLGAAPRDTGWILLACTIAWFGSLAGRRVLGAELGAFGGSLLVGLASNLYSRLRDRTAAILRVPGILLVVPGSLGFTSLSTLMAGDIESGVRGVFLMLLTAMSLVAGVLIATALLPPRRAG